MGKHSDIHICVAQPVNIEHNVTFLIDRTKLKCPEDIVSDDMGVWDNLGCPIKTFSIATVGKQFMIEPFMSQEATNDRSTDVYRLKRMYSRNKHSPDVRRVISSITGKITTNDYFLRISQN